MPEAKFNSKKLADGIWVLYIGRTTGYLVAGDKCGVVIDTGDTPGDLRKYAESVCGKPVRMAANTHGHFDHTGGNGYFKVSFMGELATEIARIPNDIQNADDFPMDYGMVVVHNGDKIDLGNRELEVFELDGHSPDSVAFLDRKARVLFVGDNIGKTGLGYKCLEPQPSVLRYAINIANIMAHRSEFDNLLYGHQDELIDAKRINWAMICALRALDGELDPQPVRPPRPPKPGHKPVKRDPATRGFVQYNDLEMDFDKRYLRNMERVKTAIGT